MFRRFVSDFHDWYSDPNFLPHSRRQAIRDMFGALWFALRGVF